jgi:hypothetical protein
MLGNLIDALDGLGAIEILTWLLGIIMGAVYALIGW